jgi:hypothetical protein
VLPRRAAAGGLRRERNSDRRASAVISRVSYRIPTRHRNARRAATARWRLARSAARRPARGGTHRGARSDPRWSRGAFARLCSTAALLLGGTCRAVCWFGCVALHERCCATGCCAAQVDARARRRAAAVHR